MCQKLIDEGRACFEFGSGMPKIVKVSIWVLPLVCAVSLFGARTERGFDVCFSVASGALAEVEVPLGEMGLVVGRVEAPVEIGNATLEDAVDFKAYVEMPFTSESFVEDELGVPFRLTASGAAVEFTVSENLTASGVFNAGAEGNLVFRVFGMKDAEVEVPVATWNAVVGNDKDSRGGMDLEKMTLLGTFTVNAAEVAPGKKVVFKGGTLTGWVNEALDYYFYTHRDYNTVPSGMVLAVTAVAENATAVVFDKQVVFSYELRSFNGQVGSGLERTVFDPAYDRPPIPGDSKEFVAWATGVAEFERGFINITNQTVTYNNGGNISNKPTFGVAENALGPASKPDPDNPYEVVSLGDGGWITMTFAKPITNGEGWDFAVFENGFIDYTNVAFDEYMAWLELAHVEVSSDGVNFVRFPSISLTRPYRDSHYSGGTGFASTEARNIHNLAGKFILGYGVPFDLEDVKDMDPRVDVKRITHVRVVDVVGLVKQSVVERIFVGRDPKGLPIYRDVTAAEKPELWEFINYDSEGNVLVDPWPTPFWQGGFDLDAVGVRHQLEEEPTQSGFEKWKAEKFSAEELADEKVSGSLADPDGDGMGNLLEYALGGEPKENSLKERPVVEMKKGELVMRFKRWREDVVYVVQVSEDLKTWRDVARNPGNVGEVVEVPAGKAEEYPRLFVRLRVREGTEAGGEN